MKLCEALLLWTILAVAHASDSDVQFDNNKPANYDSFEKLFADRIRQSSIKFHNSSRRECKNATSYADPGNCIEVCEDHVPYAIMRGNTTHFVVQTKDFVQKITIVKCESQSPCFDSVFGGMDNIEASCETTKTEIIIQAYNKISGEIERTPINISTGCVCKVSYQH